MSRDKACALVIGHTKESPGAMNRNEGLTEFWFNYRLGLRIVKMIEGVDIYTIYRSTYKQLPFDVNKVNPDFVVSLHCNAFNEKASGTEVLYYHKSKNGKKMADILVDNLVGHLGLPSRGSKPKTSEDRGGYLLRYTNAPCVIVEPFFIDNGSDLNTALDDSEGLASAYVKAIQDISKIV